MSLTEKERKLFNAYCTGDTRPIPGAFLQKIAAYIDWLEREQEALIEKNNVLVRAEHSNSGDSHASFIPRPADSGLRLS